MKRELQRASARANELRALHVQLNAIKIQIEKFDTVALLRQAAQVYGSQVKLAEKLGIAPQTLAVYVAGKGALPQKHVVTLATNLTQWVVALG